MISGLSGYKCLCKPYFKGSTCSIEITTKKMTKTTTKTSFICPAVNCIWPNTCTGLGDIQYHTMEDNNYYEHDFFFFNNGLV